MVPMGYSGARGTLIYEKNLKSEISCQTPFKVMTVSSDNELQIVDNIFYELSITATHIHMKKNFRDMEKEWKASKQFRKVR